MSQLLKEINDLRRELKRSLTQVHDLHRELKMSLTQVHDLEAALKIAQKNGFADQATLAKLRAPPLPSGLGKIESLEEARMIEIQKLEIARLRQCVREMEQSGIASILPPLQPAVANH